MASTRDVALKVRYSNGWETVTMAGVSAIQLVGGQDERGLTFTLIGIRPDSPNEYETGVLDIKPRHEELLNSSVPRWEDGTALPMALRERHSDDQE